MPPNDPNTSNDTQPQYQPQSSPQEVTTLPSQPGMANDSLPPPASVNGPLPASPSKKHLKLPVIIVGILVLLLGASAAAYYGVVAPSKPENLWASALTNTGKSYDKLVEYVDKNKDIKGMSLDGTYKLENGDFVTDGTIKGSFFEGNGELKLNIGLGTARPEIEARFLKSNGNTPDIYLKASGVKGAGSQLGPTGVAIESIAQGFDNQWISIDHTLLDNLTKTYTSQAQVDGNAAQNMSSDDVIAISQKVGESLKSYVFTDDKSKVVFTIRENVGQEMRDERKTYHYKVGVDKQHLKDFVTDLKNKLNETKLKDSLGGKPIEEVIQYENMLKDIDKMNTDNAQADVWVDMGTRLVRYVRISENGKPNNYVEFGLPYNGGDEYPFSVYGSEKEGDQSNEATFKLTVNTKTNILNLTGDVASGNTSFTTKLTFSPNNQAIKVEKPANAKQLSELLGQFFGGQSSPELMTAPSAADPGQQSLVE